LIVICLTQYLPDSFFSLTNQKGVVMSCYKKFSVLTNHTEKSSQFLFAPQRCGRWDCPTCRKIKAKKIKNKINEFFTQKEVYMLTLTDPHKTTCREAWQTFGARWNLFRTYCSREFGKFSYIRIIEPHKGEPYPHMHILINKKFPQEKIVKLLAKWGFGWQWSQLAMSPKQAGGYITKYLTKDWPQNGSAKLREYTKTRICQASQDIGAIMRPKTDWRVSRHNLSPFDAWSLARLTYKGAHKLYPYRTKLQYNNNTLMLTTQITAEPMDKDLIKYPLFESAEYSTVEVYEHIIQRDFLEVNDYLTPFPDLVPDKYDCACSIEAKLSVQ
jgi:hypothetical protein